MLRGIVVRHRDSVALCGFVMKISALPLQSGLVLEAPQQRVSLSEPKEIRAGVGVGNKIESTHCGLVYPREEIFEL